jgi:predicted TIM-barrel fold metal-dependent hydrolase
MEVFILIIDGDTHITTSKEGIGIDELLSRLEQSQIEKAIAWLQPTYRTEEELVASNRYVYEAMKKYSNMILGFGWVDPHFGVEKAKDLVKKLVNEYGFYGVKLNGAQNNFYIDDPEISLPIVETIAETGKVLAFHIGGDACDKTHPFRLAKIADLYPEVKILMVHMGGASFHDLSDAAIEVAKKHQNVLLVGSAIRDISILKALQALGSKRICFGSDTPFALMHVELAKYKALLSDFSTNDQQMVMGGNLIELFKLQN